MKIKTTLLLFTLLSGIIYLGGCSNHSFASSAVNSQLTGTWAQTTERWVYKTNGNVTQDTTFTPATGTTASFATSGGYSSASPSQGPINGYYTATSGIIYLTDTGGGMSEQVLLHILTLTDHALVLQRDDTAAAKTDQLTFTYSK